MSDKPRRATIVVQDPTESVAKQRPLFSGGATGSRAIAVYRVLGVVVFLGGWELITRTGLVSRFFLTPPSEIALTIIDLHNRGVLWGNVGITLYETLVGFFFGVIVGASFGFVIGLSSALNAFTGPFITMMNSVPRIALAPLFVLWFGIDSTSRIILVFTLVVFIILTNTIAGTQNVDRDHLTLARLLGASKGKLILKVVMPSVLPWIIAAMRVAFAYAIAGAVVGGMFLGQGGLGYLIIAGSGTFDISQIFAALVVVVVLAYVFDRLLWAVESYVLRWRD